MYLCALFWVVRGTRCTRGTLRGALRPPGTWQGLFDVCPACCLLCVSGPDTCAAAFCSVGLCTVAPAPLLPPHPSAQQPLPDISGWLYGGTTSIGNSEVHIWQLFERKWGKTSTYTFYTTPEGLPVRCAFVCLCLCRWVAVCVWV